MRYIMHMNIIQLIESFPWLVGALCIVSIFVIFAISGILIIRSRISPKKLQVHHDVAGFVFTNLGVLYSVLLGFTVVNVQQRFDKIKEISQVEASYVAELYRNSAVFSESDRLVIREALKKYAKSILNDEWNTMSNGLPHPNTSEALQNVWQAYYNVNIADGKQTVWYQESINKLNQLMSARISRLQGGEESLGTEMWLLLVVGGILIVGFIWFFGLESMATHMLMASILAASIAFLLFLIYSLDTVFSGNVSIEPEALKRVVLSLGEQP